MSDFSISPIRVVCLRLPAVGAPHSILVMMDARRKGRENAAAYTNPLAVGKTEDSASAKGISDRAAVLRHEVAAELVREVKYVMEIELRLNE